MGCHLHLGRTVLLAVAAVLISLLLADISTCKETDYNIVLIVPDDMGFNDIGLRNPDIKTPFIDNLASEGIILENSYTLSECAPSRTALLTGYYPFKIGLQHTPIPPFEPYGVPLNYKFLPKKLKDANYSTHMVGKWNLGFCSWAYTPTFRGFDTFKGFYTTRETHYTHLADGNYLDFRDNLTPISNESNTHSHNIFIKRAVEIIEEHSANQPLFLYVALQLPHEPMEVDDEYLQGFEFIEDETRQIFSGMMSAVDNGVRQLYEALEQKGPEFMDNTLIIFTSDNGGHLQYGADNSPYRGEKWSMWEGGTRVFSFVWGSMLKKRGYTEKGFFHISDWYPTLLSAIGRYNGDDQDLVNIDGINHWQELSNGQPLTRRTEIVYNIDTYSKNCSTAGIRVGKYKLLEGKFYPKNSSKDQAFADSGKNCNTEDDGEEYSKYAIYDLDADPAEEHNLFGRPEIKPMQKRLLRKIRAYKRQEKKSFYQSDYSNYLWNPQYYSDVWSPGWCRAITNGQAASSYLP